MTRSSKTTMDVAPFVVERDGVFVQAVLVPRRSWRQGLVEGATG